MGKIKCEDYRVKPNSKVKLKDWATKVKAPHKSKEEYQTMLAEHAEKLSDLQDLLSASATYGFLIIFQAMDAGGKDGMIKHVMSGVNPQGCDVFSFKAPSSTEVAHDFMWRTNACLPARGTIGIFNRSYYEDVLIARVHPDILEAQHMPPKRFDKQTIWDDRFESIRNQEKHLYRNGTEIAKFFLHISKDEQRDRFLARIDNPEKNWKITPADIEEREYWDDYMHAYEQAISATSTKESPWYIVPGDDKPTARLIVSEILVQTLADLELTYPKTMQGRREELLEVRHKLSGEDAPEPADTQVAPEAPEEAGAAEGEVQASKQAKAVKDGGNSKSGSKKDGKGKKKKQR